MNSDYVYLIVGILLLLISILKIKKIKHKKEIYKGLYGFLLGVGSIFTLCGIAFTFMNFI